MAGALYDGGPYRPGATQVAAYTSVAAAVTTAFATQTRIIRVTPTTAAYIAIGASPTATTTGIYMSAGITDYFKVNPGEKISAVQDSAGGSLYVTEMTT